MSARVAFGEKLRRHRERRGISLPTIAARTKVGASVYASLEQGDCSRWPPGVYSRSYVRGYAQAIGLDPDEVAVGFAECFPETAWPDRPVATVARTCAAGDASAAAPLRLSLEESAGDRWLRAAWRAAVLVLDLIFMLAVAAALGLAVDDFWMALSLVSVAFYVLCQTVSGRSPGAWLAGGAAPSSSAPASSSSEDLLLEGVSGTAG